MTFDDQPDPDELDELASAVVDDDATEAERNRVASDPRLTARAQAFREIADRVSKVPPADGPARDAILAAVLAAGAASGTPGSTSGEGPLEGDAAVAGSGRVVPLTPRTPSRSRRFLPAVAAAVIVVLAVPAVLIALNRDDDVDTLASSATDSATSLEAAGSTESSTGAGASNPTTTTPARSGASPRSAEGALDAADSLADLGDLRSSTELGGAVEDQLAKPSTVTGSPTSTTATRTAPTESPSTTMITPDALSASAPPIDCEPAVRTAVAGLGPLVLRAKATYQGTPAHVYGFEGTAAGATTVVVTDASTCAIVERIGA